MKILFLARSVDLNATSGDAVHVRELASGFVTNGITVHLVCVDAARNDGTGNGLRWTASSVGRSGLLRYFPLRQLALFNEALGVLSRNPVDVVYARPTGGLTGNFGTSVEVLIAWLADVPLVLEINGWAEDEVPMQRSSRFYAFRRIGRWLSRLLLLRARGIVAVDESLRLRLVSELRVSPNGVTVVPNGANVRAFFPAPTAEAKQRLSIPARAPVLVFVGNLSLEADLSPVIAGLAALTKEFPDIVLLVVGSGTDAGKYRELASTVGVADHVRFVGSIPYERVPSFINAADLALVATKKQLPGNPIKLYEYWACGKPVVGTKTQSLVFVEEVGGGRLAEAGSVESWRAEIAGLLRQPETLLDMGRRGREYVATNRSWDATAREVVAYLTRIVGSGS